MNEKKCTCRLIELDGPKGPIRGRVICTNCVDAKSSDASIQALKLLMADAVRSEITEIRERLSVVKPGKRVN